MLKHLLTCLAVKAGTGVQHAQQEVLLVWNNSNRSFHKTMAAVVYKRDIGHAGCKPATPSVTHADMPKKIIELKHTSRHRDGNHCSHRPSHNL